jgi:hypothetical protein
MLNQMIETTGTLIATIKTVNGSYPFYSKGVGKKFENLVVLAMKILTVRQRFLQV